MSSSDKTNSHHQATTMHNYHNNHLDYRNGSQMSFYDNQQPYKCAGGADDEMHRKHYFPDRQQTDAMHSGSSDASNKSEQQMPNLYHQQNGYLMKPTKNQQLANNNECELTSDDYVQPRNSKKTNSQYGKILNCKKLSSNHRNGSRPIPMLPSPPSTPPPPLNAKIKDHHDSSNKFYQEFQSNVHLGSQHPNPNRFNGNIINNNNEVHKNYATTISIAWRKYISCITKNCVHHSQLYSHRCVQQITTTIMRMPTVLNFIRMDVCMHQQHHRHNTSNRPPCMQMASMKLHCTINTRN